MRILSINSRKQLDTVKDELLQFSVHFINKGYFFKASDNGFSNRIKNAKTPLEILQAIQNSFLLPGNEKFKLALIQCIRKHQHLPYSWGRIYEATRKAVVDDAKREAKYQADRQWHGMGGIVEARYASRVEKEPFSDFKTRCDKHLMNAGSLSLDRIDYRYQGFFNDMQIEIMSEVVANTIAKLDRRIQFHDQVKMEFGSFFSTERLGLDLGDIVLEYSDIVDPRKALTL